MTFISLLKPNIKPTLIVLFFALQITACSTEELLTTVAPDIGSDTQTTTPDNNTDQNTSSGGTDSGTSSGGTDSGTSSGGTDSGTSSGGTDSGTSSGGTDSGSVTLSDIKLSWVAPAEREDSTPLSLSEISSYKIYYGTTQGQYSGSVLISDSSAVGHTFTSLASGTYYFVITTYDTSGLESRNSQEIQVTI